MARLSAAGWQPIAAPCLTIRALNAPLPPPARLQAVLAASGNAVDALPPAYRDLPLLAVGDASAARARSAGFAAVRSAAGDAAALAALAAETCDPHGRALLLAAARGQGHALAAALRMNGFRVLRRATYLASPVPALPAPALAAIEAGSVHAALFFSAETARTFVRRLPPASRTRLHRVEALAIGAPAAEAIAPLPWRRIRVALRPTQSDLLALL